MVAQAKSRLAKARGKGRGHGKKKGNIDKKNVPPPPRPFQAQGTIAFTEQQTIERRRRMAQTEARTRCAKCYEAGHWPGGSRSQVVAPTNMAQVYACPASHCSAALPG